ncbi:hypothetical protein JOQ06_021737 [Pogonophryne albipinna]|uniref:Uncharacterized protein n=1 Tax=Pogonophryne albipinna TaxID=1090488 RepID=A0AAD6ACA5_9TELE|nr:hypothetical protein JOQ06_021737 [Pogonophryne albipinna]
MAVNIPGVAVMMFFYLLVLGIGIWASFKSKREAKKGTGDKTEMALLGNRGINLVVGIFTMTATWVGGGFIVGTAEAVYNPSMGLIWAVMPVAATMCFVIGGLFFAEPMRDNKYVTMMDPFQIKYGKVPTAALSLASLISEIMWWLCVPFALTGPAVTDITKTAYNYTFQNPWVGTLEADRAWMWIDNFLLLGLGNLGLQNFHQRTLSAASSSTAKIMCFAAAFIVPTLGIPPILLGAAAASTKGEIQWVIRLSVVVVGLAGTSLTFLDNSVLMIWLLRSDLTYTLMLPQLVCVLFFNISNGYGAVLGCFIGMLLRVLSGEPLLRIPALIKFPGGMEVDGVFIQGAPVRTICMLSALASILLFSYLFSVLFNKDWVPERWDVFNVKAQYSIQTQEEVKSDIKEDIKDETLKEQNENNEACEPMLESAC